MGSCGRFIYFYNVFLFFYKPLWNLLEKKNGKQVIFPSNFFLFGKRGQFSLFFSFSILFHLHIWGGYNFPLLSFLVSKFFLFWNRFIVSFPFSQLPFLFKWVNFISLPPITSFSLGMNEQFIFFFSLHHPFFYCPWIFFRFPPLTFFTLECAHKCFFVFQPLFVEITE